MWLGYRKNASLSYVVVMVLAVIASVSAFFTVQFSGEASPAISAFMIFFIAIPGMMGLVRAVGLWRSVGLILGMAVFAIVFETIAIKTGVPYGNFSYSAALGQKLFGTTPWTAAFGWLPIALGWVPLILKRVRLMTSFVMLNAVMMTLTDLVLDPGMVGLQFWMWDTPGAYFGVPWVNFLGWLISGSVASCILYIALSEKKNEMVKEWIWFVAPLCFLLIFWIVVNGLLGQWVPALIGTLLLLLLLY